MAISDHGYIFPCYTKHHGDIFPMLATPKTMETFFSMLHQTPWRHFFPRYTKYHGDIFPMLHQTPWRHFPHVHQTPWIYFPHVHQTPWIYFTYVHRTPWWIFYPVAMVKVAKNQRWISLTMGTKVSCNPMMSHAPWDTEKSGVGARARYLSLKKFGCRSNLFPCEADTDYERCLDDLWISDK